MARPQGIDPFSRRERLEYTVIASCLWLLLLLPHRLRVPLSGWFTAYVVAPLSGMRRRARQNLARVCPELNTADRARIEREAHNNMGRLFIELFSLKDTQRIAAETPFTGGGIAALDRAKAEGRATIVVSGHFGNYDICRAGLILRGFDVGALYRPMNNRLFNARYEAAIRATGEPLFPRGRRGFGGMVRHMKDGKLLALLIDQHMDNGAELQFFGLPAYTALTAAELALKYDALLVPVYAVRQPDGLSFKVIIEEPVPHSDKSTMTQALNDSLEAQVRANMGQWLWTHRRWKRQRK